MQQALVKQVPSRVSKLRLGLAVLGCLVTAGSFVGFVELDHGPDLLFVPALLMAACAGLLLRDHLPSQLLVRAALWSNLLLGTVISLSSLGGDELGAAMAAGTALGLLALGRHGLDGDTQDFAPVAFRGSLVIALVMALADAQSLALFGGLELDHGVHAAAPLLACAALMIVALVGLYHLRVWAVVLNIAANVTIAGLASTGQLELPLPIVLALCTTAVVQLLLPAPLIVAMVRGRAPSSALAPRVRAWLVPAVVVVLAGLAVLALFSGGRLIPLH